MKKILLFLVAVFLCLPVWSQVARKSLVEEFTNASCPPCASQNPAFNALLKANTDKVIAIKYQTSFPGFDPMNQQNPGEVQTRLNYYAQSGVPVAALDGTIPTNMYGGGLGTWSSTYPGGPYGFNSNVLNYAASQTTPVELLLSHSYDEYIQNLTIDVKIINHGEEPIAPEDLRLHIALLEHEIKFTVAPGSNGERIFENVMRKMYPDVNGTSFDEAIAPGDTVSVIIVTEFPKYIYLYKEISIVSFLQNHATTEVYQAEISEPIEIGELADATLKHTISVPTNICENEVEISFEVNNATPMLEITSIELEIDINGSTQIIPWEGSLTDGGPIVIDVPVFSVNPGSNLINTRIKTINKYPDINRFNSTTTPAKANSIPENAFGDKVEEDFESVPNFVAPENALIISNRTVDMGVADRTEFGASWPIGAYETSEKAVLVNFYGMTNNQRASLVYYKMDLSNKDSMFLSFDHAYITYQAEADRLQIEVSTNCGETWTSVFNKAGTALSTGAASIDFFVPRAARWRNNVVDLSNFDGVEDAIIRFTGISAYGNNLWLDNIKIDQTVVSSSQENFLDENALSVAPNPVRQDLNLILSLDEASDCQIVLQDLTGKNTEILERNLKLGKGTHNIQYNVQKPAGLYLLTLKTQKGQITQKVTIVE